MKSYFIDFFFDMCLEHAHQLGLWLDLLCVFLMIWLLKIISSSFRRIFIIYHCSKDIGLLLIAQLATEGNFLPCFDHHDLFIIME